MSTLTTNDAARTRPMRFPLRPSLVLLLLQTIIAAPAAVAAEPDQSGSGSGAAAPGVLGEGVTGAVKARSGAPVPGVLVQPVPLGAGAGPVPEIAIFTGEGGRFAWSLPPGRYGLHLLLDGKLLARTEATVEAGRVTVVEIEVDPR